MERFSENHGGGVPAPEISAEMLERITYGNSGSCPEALSGGMSGGEGLREAWLNFGQVMKAEKAAHFNSPVSVERILERVNAGVVAPKADVPAGWRARGRVKWLSVSLVGAAAVAISVMGFFAWQPEGGVVTEPDVTLAEVDDDFSWETPIEDEIEVLDAFLLELENGRSAFDTELALVYTSLDLLEMEEDENLF